MADVSTTESGSDSSPDWGAQASTAFLDLVDNVRGKTTGPLLKAARAVVYGLVILVAALMLLVLVVAMLVRLTDIIVPGQVWSAYLVLGAIFFLVGAILWSKRRP